MNYKHGKIVVLQLVGYYNVQSRWAIVKRIMQLSDMEFYVQDFIDSDNPTYPTDGRTLNIWNGFVPLGSPVWNLN